MNNSKEKHICIQILKYFQVSSDVVMDDITDFKILKSQLYSFGDVYSFNLNGERFYVCSDYSLDDNPRYVENILSEINHLLKGRIVANPNTQPHEAKYVYEMGGEEYYLWFAEIRGASI